MTQKLACSFIREEHNHDLTYGESVSMVLHTAGTCLHTREAYPFIREGYDMSTREAIGTFHMGE